MDRWFDVEGLASVVPRPVGLIAQIETAHYNHFILEEEEVGLTLPGEGTAEHELRRVCRELLYCKNHFYDEA